MQFSVGWATEIWTGHEGNKDAVFSNIQINVPYTRTYGGNGGLAMFDKSVENKVFL